MFIASSTGASAAARRPARPTRGPGGTRRPGRTAPASSSMSVEQMSTGAPAAAVERISACISSLAPTSTPRVGSSSRNTDGCASSHLANTTFCWLPPDSEPAGLVDRAAADPQAAHVLAGALAQRARAHDGPVGRQADRPDLPDVLPRAACRASARAGGGRRSRARRRRGPRVAARAAPRARRAAGSGPASGRPQPADQLEHRVMAGARPRPRARRSRPRATCKRRTARARPRPPRPRSSSRPMPASSPTDSATASFSVASGAASATSRCAEHRVDDPRHGQRVARLGAQLDVPVAQHRDLVAQRHHVLEDVRDEDHADLAVAQHAQHVEQHLGARSPERRRRLVEDQHARLGQQRLGDLDQLPLRPEAAPRRACAAPRRARARRAPAAPAPPSRAAR